MCAFLIVMLAVLWCALLSLVCALTHVRVAAQTPPLVVGPSLLDPLSLPRRWMGAASATLFSTNFGRQDYFGFAGGDTGLPADCANVLQSTIDLYRSNMGGKPIPLLYPGVGRPTLSKARSFASGASFFPRIYLLIFYLITQRPVAGVGITFPPNTGPRRNGYLVFAGGLECSSTGRQQASGVVDILRLDTQQMIAPLLLPSGGRNYIASSSICKWDRIKSVYTCIALFAGGQMAGNRCTSPTPSLQPNYSSDSIPQIRQRHRFVGPQC